MRKTFFCLALALPCAARATVVLADEPPSLSAEQIERLSKVTRSDASAHADSKVSANGDRGTDGPAFKAALSLLADKSQISKPKKSHESLPPAVWHPDKPYQGMTHPDLGHRILPWLACGM